MYALAFNARPSPYYLRSRRRFSLINPDTVASSVAYVAAMKRKWGRNVGGGRGGCSARALLDFPVTRFFG